MYVNRVMRSLITVWLLYLSIKFLRSIYFVAFNYVDVLSHSSRVQLFEIPCTITHQALLPMDFSRQEYQSELPCPLPGDLPESGIEPMSTASPVLQEDSLQLSHRGSPT